MKKKSAPERMKASLRLVNKIKENEEILTADKNQSMFEIYEQLCSHVFGLSKEIDALKLDLKAKEADLKKSLKTLTLTRRKVKKALKKSLARSQKQKPKKQNPVPQKGEAQQTAAKKTKSGKAKGKPGK